MKLTKAEELMVLAIREKMNALGMQHVRLASQCFTYSDIKKPPLKLEVGFILKQVLPGASE